MVTYFKFLNSNQFIRLRIPVGGRYQEGNEDRQESSKRTADLKLSMLQDLTRDCRDATSEPVSLDLDPLNHADAWQETAYLPVWGGEGVEGVGGGGSRESISKFTPYEP